MDANELVTIAIDAMPLDVLADADKGQVWGVLQMALRTLEAQHAALLAEADEETTEAKKLWREAMAECEVLRQQCEAMAAELDVKQRELDAVRDGIRTVQAQTAPSLGRIHYAATQPGHLEP